MVARTQKSSDVAGGRIRVTCARCEKTRYAEVATGTRRKIVRCNCGLSASYTVNYRKSARESASGKAQAICSNAKETKIRLCDISTGGIGFTVPSGFKLSLSRGQEISVKYRGGSGSIAQRKVRIRNINGNRIGSQYA